jgi:hypothetical protein
MFKKNIDQSQLNNQNTLIKTKPALILVELESKNDVNLAVSS